MSTSKLSPYEILGLVQNDTDFDTRSAYRNKVLEFKKDREKPANQRTISSEKFRLMCRAYETISDRDKRQQYNKTGKWVSEIPVEKYTLQQLAVEPDLVPTLKNKLNKAKLEEINSQDPETGHTPLYCAARAGNVEAVLYLVQEGADPDLKTRLGSTALHVSSFYGHPDMVKCLLEVGANYTVENSFDNIPYKEAFNESVKSVFTGLQQNPFVQAAANQLNWFKNNADILSQHIDYQYFMLRQTLLHCACRKGHFKLVKWFVEQRSACLDIVDINLNSALHLASYGGYAEIVDYLLNRGANPLLVNKWGMIAEQEGRRYRNSINKVFQSVRARDMFQMAVDGIAWWFQYHFDSRLCNKMNDKGVTLLYLACRYGRTSVAKWLLENGADVNLQINDGSQSTPLHGAVFNGHKSTVELLLSYSADVSIRNKYGSTIFDDASSDEMKAFLQQYKQNLKDSKLLTVHLYSDGKTLGDAPLAQLQLNFDATFNELCQAIPQHLRSQYRNFSIARRPLNREGDDEKVIEAFCRARYGKTIFVELPLCITAHESPRYVNSGHVKGPERPYLNLRRFHGKLIPKCTNESIIIKSNVPNTQIFNMDQLVFTFAADCTQEDLTLIIDYSFSINPTEFGLPECLCIFSTRYRDKNAQLTEMPTVYLRSDPKARLYTWTQSSAYWFTFSTKHTRLPSIGSVHVFVHHVDIVPDLLTLPVDMFIQGSAGKILESRTNPVQCRCLKIREQDKSTFSNIAYHGTTVEVIRSILMDGLVMPSTVVSSGKRICPPSNHIARGVEAFNVKDFSNAIFLSPSIHYCSDSAYAIPFSLGDERLFPVLECSIRNNSFKAYPCTVPDYKPHPGDDTDAIEWRLTNPADIEIISVLFIPIMKSRKSAVRLREDILGISESSTD